MTRQHFIYLALFVLTAVLFSLPVNLVTVMDESIGCARYPYPPPHSMISYCHTKIIADHDFGVFYYNTVPEMIENLRQADVVIMGNSRTQYAFSTKTTDRYFTDKGLKYFLFGLGDGEASKFALLIMQRYNIRPKVMIINADPFFSDYMSDKAAEIVGESPMSKIRFWTRVVALNIMYPVCRTVPTACQPALPVVYRSTVNGQWTQEPISPDMRVPLNPIAFPVNPDRVKAAAKIGRSFFSALGLDPQCTVLNGIPGPSTDEDSMPYANSTGFAEALSKTLGTKFIKVSLDKMDTLEGVHFNAETAEKYSAGLVSHLDSILDACLSKNASAPHP